MKLFFLVVLSAATMAVHAQLHYVYTDLNPLRGAANSTALSINQAGIVSGYILDSATYDDLPVIWNGTNMQFVQLPSGYINGYANDINDSGMICGIVWVHDLSADLAFRLKGTTFTVLPPLNPQSAEGVGTRMNNAGDIAGVSYTNIAPDYRHAALWQNSTITDLGTLGTSSWAEDINDSGQIAGYYNVKNSGSTGSFIYQNKKMTDLGSVPGFANSQANGMNSHGWICGNLSGASGQGAFLWSPDSGMKQLAVPAGYNRATATAVNDSGVVVGRVFTNPGGAVHPVIWQNGVMTDLNQFLPSNYSLGDVSDINNAGQIVGYAYGPQIRAFVLTPPILDITSPAQGEIVIAGDPYSIQWNANGIASIKLEFSGDSGKTFQVIAANVAGNAGQFQWTAPDTLASKCRIRISDVSNATNNAVSGNFRVKGYVLTRFKPNGDYEAFDPLVHGWQFANVDSVMWPESWYQQFRYTQADPLTAQRYDVLFLLAPARAVSSNFPDWPLFANTFGIARCYESMSPVTYSPTAFRFWSQIKSPVWKGSCFGLAVTSVMAFDFPKAFNALFPNIGPYTNLYDLPINDERRKAINQVFLYQCGLASSTYFAAGLKKTARQTLADLQAMFLSEIRNDGGLTMMNFGGGFGGHEVVAYAVSKVPNTTRYAVKLYDSNCPANDCPKYGNTTLLIDSASNTWSYPPINFGSGIYSTGMFVDAGVSSYLITPVIPENIHASGPQITDVPPLQMYDAGTNAILISDSLGHAIGYHDTTFFSTLPNAAPIAFATSTQQSPVGYTVPLASYTATLNAYQDTSILFSVFGNSRVFTFWRGDAQSNQTDKLVLSNGLGAVNTDAQTKQINIETIIQRDTSELYFQLLSLSSAQNDSVFMSAQDSTRLKVVNDGAQTTFDLGITLAGNHASRKFFHAGVTFPAHTTQYIFPNWQDTVDRGATILEDAGNTGVISDSLVVVNQVSGVAQFASAELPRDFALSQNYPNPFTATSTISVDIPKATIATIAVYDVLGRQVGMVMNQFVQSGMYTVPIDAANYPAGVYLYRLTASGHTITRQFTVAK